MARIRLPMVLLSLVPLLIGAAAVSLDKWQTAGNPRWVHRDGGRVTLSAKEAATAGIISPAKVAPPGTTAVLISADVADDTPPGAITFSVHNASGETIGYWQNPLTITQGRVHAVMPAQRPAGPLRIFAGTHRQPSSATLENLQWEPVRLRMSFGGTMYGALVHGSNHEGQSFKAGGKRLAAVRVLVRRMKAADGPDLRVRLYPLKMNAAVPHSSEPPLAEAIVPRQRIPQADQKRDELSIALAADTVPGRIYIVEFSTATPCEPDNGFLLWGGIGTYADGCRYQNGAPVKDWDLHIEIYDGI